MKRVSREFIRSTTTLLDHGLTKLTQDGQRELLESLSGASLDLNQHKGLHLRKIGTPTPLVMEAVFYLQVRPLDVFPEHQEAFFESRGRFGSTVAQVGHDLCEKSKKRRHHPAIVLPNTVV